MDQSKVKGILGYMGRRVADNSASLVAFFNKNHVEPKDYLFVLTNELYDENKCLTAIKSLTSCGKANLNQIGDFGYNFIQNAMYAGYSNNFIMDLFYYADDLNVNHVDGDGDTMLHTAIYANDTCHYNIEELYSKLIDCGFDSTIKDKMGRTIVDAMKYEKRRCNKFSDKEINEVEKLFVENVAKKRDGGKESALDRILSMMGYNLTVNEKILRRELPKLGMDRYSYLLELTDVLHNELCCFAALKSLITSGDFNLDKVVADGEYNFIQNAIYAGYSTSFVIGCIDASMNPCLKNKLNINHVDEDGDTILHSAIYANDVCTVDIVALYKTLLKYGFDSNIKNNELKTIVDAMQDEKKRCNKFSNSQIVEVEHIYNDALGYYDDSFSKDEQLKNEKLDDTGLNNFLKNCRR